MAKAFSKLKNGIECDDMVTFGKHAGNTWEYVAEDFPDYVIWCVGNTDNIFAYDLIVLAIKNKYIQKKRNTTHEVDGEYVPNKVSWKYYGVKPGRNTYEEGKNEQGMDMLADCMFGQDWNDDIPF